MASTFPIVLNPAGYVPQSPAELLATLTAAVLAVNPDFTNNLPGGLIEDLSSTGTYALAQSDSAIAAIMASISPYSANPYILSLQGQAVGIQIGQPSNTSVYVMFTVTDTQSNPVPGWVIPKGFIVSDGIYQYRVVDGGVTSSNGQTPSPGLFCVATTTGAWGIPINTVDQTVTSFPSTVVITCNNVVTGVSATQLESENSYRLRVLQAWLAASQGMPRYLRTLLQQVNGVQSRLIATLQLVSGGKWEVIVGGGDPYQVAYAIYTALFDFNTLTGSVLNMAGATQASPCKITLELKPNYLNLQEIHVTGVVGMTELNGNDYYTRNVSGDPYSLHLYTDSGGTSPVDSTGFGAYVSGGVITPDNRNVTVNIIDYPDTYVIKFVNPPKQTVTMAIEWDTISPNFVNPNAISQLATGPLVNYVNGLQVGQPINVAVMISIFQNAVASVIPSQFLTTLTFSVNIDGVGTDPLMGTFEIVGDAESYFSTSASGISITQST